MKNFKIPLPHLETSTLQFRADAFNILNHANLGLPNNTTGSTAFGTITSATDPRVFQIGATLMF